MAVSADAYAPDRRRRRRLVVRWVGTRAGSTTAPDASPRASSPRWLVAAALVAVVCSVGLAIAYSLTRSPWWDEGLYADVARQFALHGELHSSVMPPEATFGLGGPTLPGMNARTYWTTPLYPVVLGLWFRVFGFGLVAMRMLSVLLSAGLMAAWGGIVATLTRSRAAALAAAALIALDSHVLWSASIGRVEALSSALAAGAILVYVRWREARLLPAVAAASALLGGAVLAHPLALVEALGLLALALLLDRRRIGVRHVAVALAVGASVLLPWALYVLQDVPTFRAQLAANVRGRAGGWSDPLTYLATDFRDRYLYHHYTVVHGVTRLRVVGFVALVPLLAYGAVIPAVRRRRGFAALALVALVSWAALAVLDGSRYVQYYAHVFPAYLAAASVPLVAILRQRAWPSRLVAIALVLGLVAPGVGGLLHRVRQNAYDREYLPAMAAVRAHQVPGAVVVGGSELGFALGFDGTFVDDMELRRRADVYVQGELYLTDKPGPWQPRVRAELAREFALVFQNARFKVYARRPAGGLAGAGRQGGRAGPPALRADVASPSSAVRARARRRLVSAE